MLTSHGRAVYRGGVEAESQPKTNMAEEVYDNLSKKHQIPQEIARAASADALRTLETLWLLREHVLPAIQKESDLDVLSESAGAITDAAVTHERVRRYVADRRMTRETSVMAARFVRGVSNFNKLTLAGMNDPSPRVHGTFIRHEWFAWLQTTYVDSSEKDKLGRPLIWLYEPKAPWDMYFVPGACHSYETINWTGQHTNPLWYGTESEVSRRAEAARAAPDFTPAEKQWRELTGAPTEQAPPTRRVKDISDFVQHYW